MATRGARGFTLVEAVIAIGLFAAVAISTYGSFRSGLLAYERIESQLGHGYELKMLVRGLSEELRNAIYYAEVPFEGESDSIKFFTRLRRFNDKQLVEDLYQVTYRFRSRDLERSEGKIRKKFNDKEGVRESLLTLESLRFQFAYRKQDGSIEWRNEWAKNPYGGLPRAIRIVVKEKNIKDEKSFQFLIPHGILGTSK